ncbi:TetR family transcriptional regulator [Sphingorhabdus lutea]|uniref:TetR family transcriptional regulator n=1 Tax=Sphingorhabdus lutea TaxID=1913578 RepID=A0A1L3JE21_9SPHN|nr:helix-turn-helix domain-containing protein [Sphingorhabdus lutea]APG63387.1 TetR family transcriptional regulator [Sphingorhabdus lutea]
MATSPKRKRLAPAESRLQALEAARSLLIEAGPQAVTLKAVAARINRTHANLLHHFGSANELQVALAAYLAETICATIITAINDLRVGDATPRYLTDLVFDAFDKEGAGALASWMILNGNVLALNPVVDTIHKLVDEISDNGHEDRKLHEETLDLVLLALGDALLGESLAQSLGLPRDTARRIAEQRLTASDDFWNKKIQA